jgi:DNA-binding transcriptional LysR family regulator
MELRQLSYLVAVAEEGQVTRAAERVSVAQPAISAQIRRLERELGETLFHRDQRGVTLTAAGEAFLPHARAALAAVARGRETVTAMRGLLEGRLSVGVSGPMDRRFAAALGDYSRAHPAIEIALREDNRDRIVSSVARGDIGVAQICMTGEPVPPAVRTTVVAVDPLVLAVGAGHRFAGRQRVRIGQLEDEPLITLEEGTGLRAAVVQACRAVGFSPRVVAETTEIRSLLDLTAAGVGLAVVPQSVGDDPRLALVELTGPRLERPVGLAWNEAATSPAVRAFLALARRHFADEEPAIATVTALPARTAGD